MKILICGYGIVGKHLYEEFNLLKDDIYVYDIIPHKNVQYGYIDTKYDYAFICVPTDNKEGRVDASIVEDCISKINADAIIIRSTVPIGFTEAMIEKYNKNIIFSPEYYGATLQSPKSPNFLILGGEMELCNKVADLYHKVKSANFHIRFTNSKTAELAKYMENCYLAMKVTFCGEFFNIAKENDIYYNELRELFVMDERMGESHTYIDPEKPYYDSHCLNKDTVGLLSQCMDANISTPLLKSMIDINNSYR